MLTLLEIDRECDATLLRRARELDDLMRQAWYTAALPRFKKFPKLSELMTKNKNAERKIPAANEQADALRRWAGKSRH